MRAGFATSDITPAIGAPLNGFVARASVSTGVDLPLKARALWLENDGVCALLVVTDLLGLSQEWADSTVQLLAERLGIRARNIVLAATHTHSGPMSARLRGVGVPDDQYLEFAQARVVEAARQAKFSQSEVSVDVGTAPASVGVNRRQKEPGGGIVLGQNPDGPTDRLVRVVRFCSPGRSVVLFEHACHPYCLGGDSTLISPDFWGHAGEALEAQGYEALGLNGCSGDIAPWKGFQGPAAAKLEGSGLAASVLEACANSRRLADNVLSVGSRDILIPHDSPPALQEIERELAQEDRTLRSEERQDGAIRQRMQDAWREWTAELADAMGNNSELPPIPARISIIRIGRTAIVALPGEVFFSIGEQIAKRLDADFVCVAAYCHGYIGYVPTEEAYDEGGYEVSESHRYVGLWRADRRVGAILEDEVCSLWHDLGGSVR